MSADAKVVIQWRNQEGINLRVVVVPADYGYSGRKVYILEQRHDQGKDALGNERWMDAEAETYADELLRKLGETVGQ